MLNNVEENLVLPVLDAFPSPRYGPGDLCVWCHLELLRDTWVHDPIFP